MLPRLELTEICKLVPPGVVGLKASATTSGWITSLLLFHYLNSLIKLFKLEVAHVFNLSTLKAEASRSLSSRPAWYMEFQDNQGYTEKPCLRKTKTKQNGAEEVAQTLNTLAALKEDPALIWP